MQDLKVFLLRMTSFTAKTKLAETSKCSFISNKEGFQTDARQMAPSNNQISSHRTPANHRATSNYQFENPSKRTGEECGKMTVAKLRRG